MSNALAVQAILARSRTNQSDDQATGAGAAAASTITESENFAGVQAVGTSLVDLQSRQESVLNQECIDAISVVAAAQIVTETAIVATMC